MVKMRSSTYLAAWKSKAINNQQHHKHHEFALRLCSLWCLHSLSLSLSLGVGSRKQFLFCKGSDSCKSCRKKAGTCAHESSLQSWLLQWEALFQLVWNLGPFFLQRPFKPGGFPANWVWDLQLVWCPPVLAGYCKKWPIIDQVWRKSRLFIIGWKVRFEVGLRTWQTPYLSVWYTSSVETLGRIPLQIHSFLRIEIQCLFLLSSIQRFSKHSICHGITIHHHCFFLKFCHF